MREKLWSCVDENNCRYELSLIECTLPGSEIVNVEVSAPPLRFETTEYTDQLHIYDYPPVPLDPCTPVDLTFTTPTTVYRGHIPQPRECDLNFIVVPLTPTHTSHSLTDAEQLSERKRLVDSLIKMLQGIMSDLCSLTHGDMTEAKVLHRAVADALQTNAAKVMNTFHTLRLGVLIAHLSLPSSDDDDNHTRSLCRPWLTHCTVENYQRRQRERREDSVLLAVDDTYLWWKPRESLTTVKVVKHQTYTPVSIHPCE